MRLDPDLLRDILTRHADAPANQLLHTREIPGRSDDEVLEHLEMLADAGFIEARFLGAGSGRQRVITAHVKHVTYAGQEFLAATCNDTLRAETKKTFRERGIDLTIDLASRTLGSLGARAMELPA